MRLHSGCNAEQRIGRVSRGTHVTARESVTSHSASRVGCGVLDQNLRCTTRQLSQRDQVKARAGIERGVTVPLEPQCTFRMRVRMSRQVLGMCKDSSIATSDGAVPEIHFIIHPSITVRRT